jgi:hypothetical protein
MNKIYGIILLLTLMLPAAASASGDHNKLAEFLFVSGKSVSPEQFGRLSAKEYAETLKLIRFQADACWEFVKNDLPYHRDLFSTFDFSGDGVADLIFSSYCAQPEKRNYLWVRDGTQYLYAGFIGGTILKMVRDQTSKGYLILVSTGPAGGRTGAVSLYELQREKGAVSLRIRKKILAFDGLVAPSLGMSTVHFTVGRDRKPLRTAPERQDDYDAAASAAEKRQVYGNIVAEFASGAKGLAFSELKDIRGVQWWFVVMQKEARPVSSRFSEDPEGLKAGWMEAQGLEIAR